MNVINLFIENQVVFIWTHNYFIHLSVSKPLCVETSKLVLFTSAKRVL